MQVPEYVCEKEREKETESRVGRELWVSVKGWMSQVKQN